MRAPLRIGLAAVTLAAVAGAGFLAGLRHAGEAPATTRIELVACGLAPGPEPIDLALAPLLRDAPAGVSLGPFALGGIAEPVTIRFEPLDGAREKTARRAGGVVTLPVAIDRPDHPDAITLHCRYGAPARVAFRFGGDRVELPVLAEGPEAGAPGS